VCGVCMCVCVRERESGRLVHGRNSQSKEKKKERKKERQRERKKEAGTFAVDIEQANEVEAGTYKPDFARV